jgi:hypothetical protein
VAHNPYEPPKAEVRESPISPHGSENLSKWALGPRIIVAVAWLTLCGGYWIWAGFKRPSWLVIAAGIVVVVASLGVIAKWRWSQWVLYAFVLFESGGWLYLLWGAIRSGRFPLESMLASVLSLVPGLMILLFSVWAADTVRQRFRQPAYAA